MIVTGGENVYCGEVEAVIYEHPAVREAAASCCGDRAAWSWHEVWRVGNW
jgi:acyl-CoA synthetase (AMP-forming)/AMP-acid ligase II